MLRFGIFLNYVCNGCNRIALSTVLGRSLFPCLHLPRPRYSGNLSFVYVSIVLTLTIHVFFQFATVEVVRMTLQKFIKQSFNKAGGWVADLVAIALCVACFIGSFPYITQVFTMCHHFFV